MHDICREHEISEALYYDWRDRLLEGGRAAIANPRSRTPEGAETKELKKRISQLERALGRKTYELEIAGEASRGWVEPARETRSRELVAKCHRPATVARVMQVSRQAIYRTPVRRPQGAGPGRAGPDDAAIVEVAKANPTDGTRMVAALATRDLRHPVNRKRAQRVMRDHKLLQRSRNEARRRRAGYFRVRRPDELWHMDMTKVWTAEHGWVYLHAIADCCTQEIAGWSIDPRPREASR